MFYGSAESSISECMSWIRFVFLLHSRCVGSSSSTQEVLHESARQLFHRYFGALSMQSGSIVKQWEDLVGRSGRRYT